MGHTGEEKGGSLERRDDGRGEERRGAREEDGTAGEERRDEIREKGLACRPTCSQIQILLPLPAR